MRSATWWRPHANEIDQYGSTVNYPQPGDLLVVEWNSEVRVGICLGRSNPEKIVVIEQIHGWRLIMYDVLLDDRVIQTYPQDTRLMWRKG